MTKVDRYKLLFLALCILGIFIIYKPQENDNADTSNYEASTVSSQDISSSDSISKDDKAVCWVLAEKTVKSYLKSPSSAKFPFSFSSEGVAFDREDNTYYVAGWVEADNSFGANTRSGFLVTLEKNGDDFEVVSCSIEGN